MKKRLVMVFVSLMLIATMAIPVCAADAHVITKLDRSWSRYVAVQRTNWRAAKADVLILNAKNCGIDLQMLNNKHKVIWRKDKAIVGPYGNGRTVGNTYTFGTNYKLYYLQFRSYKSRTSTHVYVNKNSNCKVYLA